MKLALCAFGRRDERRQEISCLRPRARRRVPLLRRARRQPVGAARLRAEPRRNLADGSVEAYAIGSEVLLEEFQRHLAEGPRGARVTGVEESEAPVNNRYKRFEIEGFW